MTEQGATVNESARQLRAVQAEVDAGRLPCSAATRNPLEGAVLALDAVADAGGDEVPALTDVPR